MKFLHPNTYCNHADFRLMSKKALGLLNEYKEKVVFLRGLVPDIGLKSTTVSYSRIDRALGKSKYNYAKMFELAWRGITNYSIFPLRFILFTGILLVFLALFVFTLLIFNDDFNNTNTLIAITSMGFFCGLLMTSLGIVGEYIAKILIEVKGRPPFQIESTKNI